MGTPVGTPTAPDRVTRTQTSSVLALIADPSQRGPLHRALPDARLRFCETCDALVELAHAEPPRLVLTPARDARFMSVAPALCTIARLATPPRFVLHIPLTPRDLIEVRAVLRSGIIVELAIAGGDTLVAVIRSAMVSTVDQTCERALLARLLPAFPNAITPYIAACILRATSGATVGEAAALASTSVRTLEDRLARDGLPTARLILSWTRVLHAAWRLAVLGQPIKQVVSETSIPSRRALGNVIKRYTGLTPTAIAEPGGFTLALDQFLMVVSRTRAVDARHADERPRIGAAPAMPLMASADHVTLPRLDGVGTSR